jgi:hypothetical protein
MIPIVANKLLVNQLKIVLNLSKVQFCAGPLMFVNKNLPCRSLKKTFILAS